MENGQRGASEIAVATYLAYFHVVGPEMDRLIAMCREIWAKDWLQPHGELVPEELRTLVTHETTATLINEYEPMVVPGSYRRRATRQRCSARLASFPRRPSICVFRPGWSARTC